MSQVVLHFCIKYVTCGMAMVWCEEKVYCRRNQDRKAGEIQRWRSTWLVSWLVVCYSVVC